MIIPKNNNLTSPMGWKALIIQSIPPQSFLNMVPQEKKVMTIINIHYLLIRSLLSNKAIKKLVIEKVKIIHYMSMMALNSLNASIRSLKPNATQSADQKKV